jgi:hypothetical protein
MDAPTARVAPRRDPNSQDHPTANGCLPVFSRDLYRAFGLEDNPEPLWKWAPTEAGKPHW